MTIIDRIKYDGNSNDLQWLIYKCPSEQFVLGSQLIVNQGQEALFIKGGKAFDLFGPGTYTLCTGNLPLLNKMVNLPFGGKTPFTAEVFYINKTVNLDIKWGTSTPIPIEDPQYGLILNIAARGQYGINIIDSRLFVSRIIGAVPNGTIINHLMVLRYFNGLINAKIKSVTAEYMIKKQISFLEISQYLSELSGVFKITLNNEFERFGIEIVNFYCESIAPNPSEYEKFRAYKEEFALGKKIYTERRMWNYLDKLADNSSLENFGSTGVDMIKEIKEVLSNTDQNTDVNKTQKQIECQKCGAKNSLEMKFCGSCGSKLVKNIICNNCGTHMHASMRFCGNCGKKL